VSVALMAKVYVPAAPETVPVMAPVLLMPRPVGSAPLAIKMVLEPVPPLTVMVAPAYAVFVAPAVNAPDAGLKVIAGFTVMEAVVAVLVVSLMLVAVTVTLEMVVPVAVRVVAGALPVALDGLTVPAPAPVAAKVAPEALPSFVSAAVSASVWPESSVMPVVTVENEIPIGVRVTVTEALWVGSFTLVAFSTAEVPVTGLAAV